MTLRTRLRRWRWVFLGLGLLIVLLAAGLGLLVRFAPEQVWRIAGPWLLSRSRAYSLADPRKLVGPEDSGFALVRVDWKQVQTRQLLESCRAALDLRRNPAAPFIDRLVVPGPDGNPSLIEATAPYQIVALYWRSGLPRINAVASDIAVSRVPPLAHTVFSRLGSKLVAGSPGEPQGAVVRYRGANIYAHEAVQRSLAAAMIDNNLIVSHHRMYVMQLIDRLEAATQEARGPLRDVLERASPADQFIFALTNTKEELRSLLSTFAGGPAAPSLDRRIEGSIGIHLEEIELVSVSAELQADGAAKVDLRIECTNEYAARQIAGAFEHYVDRFEPGGILSIRTLNARSEGRRFIAALAVGGIDLAAYYLLAEL